MSKPSRLLFGGERDRIATGDFFDAQRRERVGRWQGLCNLARKAFLDRNAQGMPERERLKIKAQALPYLRQAIKHAKKSRDALIARDVPLYECERDRARMYGAFARLEFFQPFANEVGERDAKLAGRSSKGGAATAQKFARPELEDLIRGCLKRGEKTRTYAKEWADAYGVSADTIERTIKRIKGDSAQPKFRKADRPCG